MTENAFYTFNGENDFCFEEKRSKFIALSKPVADEEECKNFIKLVKNKYPDATHVCYAYTLGQKSEKMHSNDDGEPSGSAGLPILKTLKTNELTNSIIIVVRYFGGTQLGVSGLYRAYSKAANGVVATAVIHKMIECNIYEFRFTYSDFSKIGVYLSSQNLQILKQDYSDVVRVEVAVPTHNEKSYFSDFKSIVGGSFMKNKLKTMFINRVE